METRGNALESRGDSAFNALGLVKKVGLSVICESIAQRKAKKSNTYFDFRKIINRCRKCTNHCIFNRICIGFPIENTVILDDFMINQL